MITHFVLWLLGMAARNSQQHLDYQANTITHRNVLSAIYLGLRVANDKRFEFSLDELGDVAMILLMMVQKHARGGKFVGIPQGQILRYPHESVKLISKLRERVKKKVTDLFFQVAR